MSCPGKCHLVLRAAGFIAAAALIIGATWNATVIAQNYPARAVRFLVPNPPGGGTDLVARITAQKVNCST